jgi:hypothetical protein
MIQGRQNRGEHNRRLGALYEALNSRLQLVNIELEGNDDPQVIFETLNARGAPLLPSDLLRNFVFLRASRNKEDAQALYQKYWAPFDTELDAKGQAAERPFWKEEERQGRSRRSRLDLFMQHFLSFKLGREVNIGHLFQEYRQWIKGAERYPRVSAELEDLNKYAGIFRGFLVPDLDTRVGRFAARLRALDTSTVYPLLLGLVGEHQVPPAELDGIVVDLESFLVRRMICDRTNKNYNRLFLLFLRELAKVGPSRAAFQQLLLAQEGDAGDWPDDAAFRRGWLELPAYKALNPWKVETVLRALEHALVTEKREKITIHNQLTVEHVLPQKWEAHWPLPDGRRVTEEDDDDQIVTRERMLHTFGNLTLLTHSLNAAIKNGAFATKRPEITKQSALQLNAYFQNIAAWDEGAIRARGLWCFASPGS